MRRLATPLDVILAVVAAAPARAQLIGDRTQAHCSSVNRADVTNSTITVIRNSNVRRRRGHHRSGDAVGAGSVADQAFIFGQLIIEQERIIPPERSRRRLVLGLGAHAHKKSFRVTAARSCRDLFKVKL